MGNNYPMRNQVKEKLAASVASTPSVSQPPIVQPPVESKPRQDDRIASSPALPHAISLRDFFAAAALQGAIAYHGMFPRDTLVADCYRIADQMIAAERQG